MDEQMNEQAYIAQITDQMVMGRLDSAQDALNQGLQQFPQSGQLHFLCAAVSAQNEDYPKALDHYQLALQATPNLHIARFQMGLLLASLQQGEPALEVLTPLSGLENHYLGSFAQAICALVTGDVLNGKAFLQQGIQQNQENLSLNRDMQTMLMDLEADLAASSESEPVVDVDASPLAPPSSSPTAAEPTLEVSEAPAQYASPDSAETGGSNTDTSDNAIASATSPTAAPEEAQAQAEDEEEINHQAHLLDIYQQRH